MAIGGSGLRGIVVAGHFLMLPDGYKNTAETAWGSLLFLNNFIQYITAGDYWDVSNDFKPLMHTWLWVCWYSFTSSFRWS